MDAPDGSDIPTTLTCRNPACAETFDFHEVETRASADNTKWEWRCPRCGRANATQGFIVKHGGDIPL
ncbi:hypothetical protein [Micromonospora globbae]|uniref:hypothetical protein n=1 Tax=Micromonospora globbae TaxID=1894969 RepID=UPI0011C38960|nr:hypothetical protein [Micromonospora globbae]